MTNGYSSRSNRMTADYFEEKSTGRCTSREVEPKVVPLRLLDRWSIHRDCYETQDLICVAFHFRYFQWSAVLKGDLAFLDPKPSQDDREDG